MIEKRRHARTTIDLPCAFALKGATPTATGIAKDISIGGMFIETSQSVAFGAEVVVRVILRTPATGQDTQFDLPGVVRWVRSDGMGVQFGLLGALETHAITELHKR